MTNTEALKTAAAKHDTGTLLGALLILEAKPSLTVEERMVKAATSDVITERHGINDAMDEVFMDLDFTGTYTDAILICLARVAA
jgi:hypothetical protein